jgi:2-polyprenyl-6-methoxyphenol hydroxylase-like FAD-dependent oxidoreductase
MVNPTTTRNHAIVIGASMAGLLAARVLSKHFEKVTVLERDPVHDQPESRKGQPQTHHIHALLAQGLLIIKDYFPGIDEELTAGGALLDDMGIKAHWYQYGGYRKQFASGLMSMTMSRPYLEHHVRRRLLALPNVTLIDSCAVTGPLTNPEKTRIIGVKATRRADQNIPESFEADLVVDTSGRGAAAPKWLENLGYPRPTEDEVKINISYSTQVFRRSIKNQADIFIQMVSAAAPHENGGAFLFPIEDDRWIMTAGAYEGRRPPSDYAGLMEYLRTLPSSNVYDAVAQEEPIGEVITYSYPSSLRRNYHQLKRFPEGYLVMGDAFASFNPIYGQGMTSAALQCRALDETLQQPNLPSLWKPFFKRLALVIDLPWQLTVREDFRYPQVQGQKLPLTDLLNAYVAKVHQATHHDEVVYAQFLQVMNLMAPATSLMTPAMLWRVLVGK